MSYHTGFLNCIYSGSYHVCFFFLLKSDAIEINSDINRIDPMTTDRGVECFFSGHTHRHHGIGFDSERVQTVLCFGEY